MKYATAVYGQAMINAAEVDAQGRLDGKVGRVTKETISAHISVPVEGIKLMDVSTLEGDSSHLRHMVIVDHENEKVVLSIRGTFSLEEIVLDVVADSREFCGGEVSLNRRCILYACCSDIERHCKGFLPSCIWFNLIRCDLHFLLRPP